MKKIIVFAIFGIFIIKAAWSQIDDGKTTTSKIVEDWNKNSSAKSVSIKTKSEIENLNLITNAGLIIWCADCEHSGLILIGPKGPIEISRRMAGIK